MKRREFIHTTALSGIVSTIHPFSAFSMKSKNSIEKLNIGIIGTGLRGQNHLNVLLNREDCNVTTICDIDERMLTAALKMYSDRGFSAPKVYTGDVEAYKDMLEKENLDGVIIATPWRWHVPMAVTAMENGIYTGLEVAGAASVEECWELVRVSEATGVHLYFLENVCFRRDVMAILQMVRKGLFGELIHLEGGYQHDLRGVKFNDGVSPYNTGVEFGEKAYSEARWRTMHSIQRNGDLYPTHGLGPLAQYTSINRGNKMEYLVSMASKSRGLQEYIRNHPKGGDQHPNADQEFRLGDKVTTMIKTTNGETMVLHHDTNLPRPYSLGFRVQGTKGLWMKVRDGIHIEGMSEGHRWDDAAQYLEEYDHPLWKKYEKQATGAGHGGMDFFLIHSFVEHVKRNQAPPFDVYDAASWMAITPLSEQSISMGSAPQIIPDFTSGLWMDRKNTFALDDAY